MNIVFVTDTLWKGGSERVISVLANSMAQKGHKVSIICLREHKVEYEIAPSVRLIYMDDHCSKNNWFKKIVVFRRLLTQLAPDVVIPFMVQVFIFTLFSSLGTRYVIIPSERNDPYKHSVIIKIMRRLLLFRADAFVVQTNYIKAYYPKWFQRNIEIINNPIDEKQYSHHQWSKDSKRFVTVARLDEQKNQAMMIRAFAEVHSRHPEFSLHLYGQGPLKRELSQLIESLDAQSYIKLEGTSSNIAKVYENAYGFLLTSHYEGFSNSMMEAICSGLPIISTKVSGATDVIKSGDNGILINVDSKGELVDALEKVISNPQRTQQLTHEVIKLRPLFELSTVVNKWETLIKRYSNGK